MMTTPVGSTSSGGNTPGGMSSTSFSRGPVGGGGGGGGGFASSSARNPSGFIKHNISSFGGGGGGAPSNSTSTNIGDGTNMNATTTGSSGDTGQQQQQPVVTTMSMPSLHMDYIHDIQYDYYGRRLATCSADRFIRVWDLTEQGEWKSHKGLGEWQAHRGTVNAISWAHPEYGQLLASCGSDHSVIIWEEREHQFVSAQTQTASSVDPQQQQQPQPVSTTAAEPSSSGTATTATTHWVSKATLTDATQSVTCLQFAPHHLGLKIASGSSDGYVRIHEAIDVMNLLHWSLTATIPVVATGNNEESTSWSLNNNKKDNLPSSLLSSALVARSNTYELGVTALSWCNGRFESPTFVVGTGQGDLHIYRYGDQTRSWNLLLKLPSHERSILDVSWAPNVGRSYHLIASAGKDRILKVHKLNRHRSSSSNTTTGRGTSGGSTTTDTKKSLDGSSGSNSSPSRTGGGGATPRPALELESSQVLSSPKQEEVWKCVWNVTGTVLASSGDGGIVYLWKSDFLSRDWKCVGEVMGATATTTNTGTPSSNQNEMTQ